ncbi:MAG: PAS domain S-box protein [Tindallia sp. MSAO_Bac2]|nr:MAG: PAS domain S-box protein [Tindallia sp. MSAO_Bac2]
MDENYLKKELYEQIKKDSDIFDFIQSGSLDGIWYWDLESPENEWMSPKFWRTLGYDPVEKEHLSSEWQDIIFPEDLVKVKENLKKHYEDPDYPFDQIVRYLHKNGSTVWVRCRGMAIRDENGKPVRLLGSHIEITRSKEAEEEHARLSEEYEKVFNGTQDALFLIEVLGPLQFRFVRNNLAHQKKTGISLEQIMHRTPQELLGQEIGDLVSGNYQRCVDAKDIVSYEEELDLPGGKRIWSTTLTPIMKDEETAFIVGSGSDITERVINERKRKASEMLLLKVIDTIPMRIFWKDRDLKYLGCNTHFASDSGWSHPKDLIGKTDYDMSWKDFAESYQKDDRDVMDTEQEKVNYIEKVINQDGDLRFVRTSKIPLYDHEEKVFGMLGTFEDITDTLKLEEELRKSEQRYEELAEKSKAIAFELDSKGLFTYVSPSAKTILGYSQEELVGKCYFYDIASPEKRTSLKEYGESVLAKGETVSDFEHQLQKKNGQEVWVTTNGFCLLDEHGKTKAFRGMDVDITHLKKAEEKIRYLSYHDQLTGLYNRHFFETESERLDTSRNWPLTVMMVDANGLKLTNDAFGHHAGDELLVKMAQVLKNSVRSDDIISRIGGDEYVLLLPHTTEEEAGSMVERIQAHAASVTVRGLPLSFSYGFYTKATASLTMEDALKLAETKMYNQKNERRKSLRKEMIQGVLERLFDTLPDEKCHGENVADLCYKMGKKMGIEGEDLQRLKLAGYCHDIGKIAIDQEVLSNNGYRLTAEDREEIKRHSETGYVILNSSSEYLGISEDVLQHHEHYDGKGYPSGLKGNEINLNAQIISVANFYDGITRDRPHCKANSQAEALKHMVSLKGKRFNPTIVDTLVNLLSD